MVACAGVNFSVSSLQTGRRSVRVRERICKNDCIAFLYMCYRYTWWLLVSSIFQVAVFCLMLLFWSELGRPKFSERSRLLEPAVSVWRRPNFISFISQLCARFWNRRSCVIVLWEISICCNKIIRLHMFWGHFPHICHMPHPLPIFCIGEHVSAKCELKREESASVCLFWRFHTEKL